MNDITLEIAGQRIRGWVSFEIASDLLVPTDAWRVEVPLQRGISLPLGGRCTLAIDGEIVLTGILEGRRASLSATDASVELRGRDLACLLTDTSAAPAWSWESIAWPKLLTKVTAYCGITDVTTTATHPARQVKAEIGESCWDLLHRHARQAEVLIWMAPEGRLRAEVPAYQGVPDRTLQASDCLSVELDEGIEERRSEVAILGQYDDGEDGIQGVTATWTDEAFPYFKPLVVGDSDADESLSAEKRARYEGERRAWEGWRLTATVRGLGSPTLWRAGQLVAVDLPLLGVAEKLLVTGRRFKRSRQSGTTTDLELRRPEVFLG